jgi:ribosomal protein S18 acetylase RimI-like enzyme
MEFHLLQQPAELEASFELMRQLRPHLNDAVVYTGQLIRQSQAGYVLLGAFRDERVAGLIGFRESENLLYGRFIYVDDLIVDPAQRHSGLGGRLLSAARDEARKRGCAHFVLDTGLHMALAQRFYFHEGLLAKGMHFVQPLTTPQENRHA